MSRKTDAEVAEKVMGYDPECFLCKESIDKEGHCSNCGVRLINHYSTDIAAAWGVVEKLKKPSNWIQLWNTIDEGWFCQILHRDNSQIASVGGYDTAPMAICKAALKAVGHGS